MPKRKGVAVIIDGGAYVRAVGPGGPGKWEVLPEHIAAIEEATGKPVVHITIVDIAQGRAMTQALRRGGYEGSAAQVEVSYRRSVRAFYDAAKARLGAGRLRFASVTVPQELSEDQAVQGVTSAEREFFEAGRRQRAVDTRMALCAMEYLRARVRAVTGAIAPKHLVVLASPDGVSRQLLSDMIDTAAESAKCKVWRAALDTPVGLRWTSAPPVSDAHPTIALAVPPVPGRQVLAGPDATAIPIPDLPAQVNERLLIAHPDFATPVWESLGREISSGLANEFMVQKYKKIIRGKAREVVDGLETGALDLA